MFGRYLWTKQCDDIGLCISIVLFRMYVLSVEAVANLIYLRDINFLSPVTSSETLGHS